MDDKDFYESSVKLSNLFDTTHKTARIPTPDEQDLFFKYKHQTIDISKIADEYMWLVSDYVNYYFIKYYNELEIDVDELIHAGSTGLMLAIPKFNPAKALEEHYTFASYAAWWVKRSLSQYLELE